MFLGMYLTPVGSGSSGGGSGGGGSGVDILKHNHYLSIKVLEVISIVVVTLSAFPSIQILLLSIQQLKIYCCWW